MTCIPLLNYTKYGLRRYTLSAYFLSFYYGQNVCCTFTSEIKDYYYYYYYLVVEEMECYNYVDVSAPLTGNEVVACATVAH